MGSTGIIARLRHTVWGVCELIRVEGADWIVRVVAGGRQIRVPPASRQLYTVEANKAPTKVEDAHTPVPSTATPMTPQVPPDGRSFRRLFESLRNGLPPTDGLASKTAIGFSVTARAFDRLLNETKNRGGHAMVVRGAYGQGKTFALRVLEEMAVEKGFVVAHTEVDAAEIQLHKPDRVYRDLMRHLRVPGERFPGAKGLAQQAAAFLRARFNKQTGRRYSREVYPFLMKELDCSPLAWLFSDPQIDNDESLIGVLACDLRSSMADARRRHTYLGSARDWPVFNASTQGDFASYILSGLGRMSRLLGFRGLIIILDEMEKWQNLNWVEQSKAGNLLGGLIWGATAPEGRRSPRHCPPSLVHSRRSGGYPFSTGPVCHLGLAIAMTPRGCNEPERVWESYGPITMHDLPSVQTRDLDEYCRNLAPQYAAAYGLSPASSKAPEAVIKRAVDSFHRQGTYTARSAVQAVVAAFDNWQSGT